MLVTQILWFLLIFCFTWVTMKKKKKIRMTSVHLAINNDHFNIPQTNITSSSSENCMLSYLRYLLYVLVLLVYFEA